MFIINAVNDACDGKLLRDQMMVQARVNDLVASVQQLKRA